MPLTTAEMRLLLAFLRQPSGVISRRELYRHIYHTEPVSGSRSIDVMVGRVRRKLSIDGVPTGLIKTIHGRGYTFVAPVEVS